MGSGNCSCICQAMLNQLFPPPHYSFGLTESRENATHVNKTRHVWVCSVNGHPSVPHISKNPLVPKAETQTDLRISPGTCPADAPAVQQL